MTIPEETQVPVIPNFSSSSLNAQDKAKDHENSHTLTAENNEITSENNNEVGQKQMTEGNPITETSSAPSSFALPSFKMSSLFGRSTGQNQQSQCNEYQSKDTQEESQEPTDTQVNRSSLFDSSMSQGTETPTFSFNFRASSLGKRHDIDESMSVADEESQKNLNESLKILSGGSKDQHLDENNIQKSSIQENVEQSENNENESDSGNAQLIIEKVPDFSAMFSKAKPKTVRLSNGFEFQLKPKAQSIFKKSATTDDDSPKSYGVDINKVYVEMEKMEKMKKLRESNSNTKTKRYKGPLWVEKYRPKSFLDLVGNEKANRLALRWLKHWSTAVYGEDISDGLSKLSSRKNFNAGGDDSAENQQPTDVYNRPNKRILLLHGPPGIGKTTIAHMITKHLNYDAMEINASDERSGQSVKEKIHNAMDTHTFSGNPTCIVADEIDGASENGFIKVLIDLVIKDARATRNIAQRSSGGGKKTKSRDKLILRPIIAICNDLYAPVLEKLRPHCEVISFRKPNETQIKDRLEKICSAENMMMTSKEMSQIVAISNLDIRSCLNLLQFNGDSIIDDDMQQVRAKDSNLTWYKIVDMIFKLDLQRSKSETFSDLQNDLNSVSSIEKIVNGCFQVYPQTVYSDPALIKKSDALGDWLYFYDIMLNSKYQQNSDLVWYCNQVPLKFYSLFAEGKSTSKPKNYSIHNSWEYFELQKSNFDICQKAITDNVLMKPSMFSSLNSRDFVAIEILPIINNYILNPSFTDKDKSFLSNGDSKRKIDHLLNLLNDFNFKIENVISDQGIKALALLPIMDSVTTFQKVSQFKSLDSQRQTLLRNLLFEAEKRKRAITATKRKFHETQDAKSATVTAAAAKEENNLKVAKNNGSVDFFKRSYATLNKGGENSEATKAAPVDSELKVWIKYHEGFSNAVRKNVSWNDLWS
ncbi:Ctf18 protein [Saccharomycopsis crataegensis]|uniref:Ctf18 protein n=1 Tax=Saccharomycopsis crataegensis TaxID=43959 RepID=A0AAV5QDL4_9ASCO|nr:Ctf18 protein [Saccharomycopsis crataegensis]